MMVVRADAGAEVHDYVSLVPSVYFQPVRQIFHFRRQPPAAAAAAGKRHVLRAFRVALEGAQTLIKILGAPEPAAPFQRMFTLDDHDQFRHGNPSFTGQPVRRGPPISWENCTIPGAVRKFRTLFPKNGKTKARNKRSAAGSLMTYC